MIPAVMNCGWRGLLALGSAAAARAPSGARRPLWRGASARAHVRALALPRALALRPFPRPRPRPRPFPRPRPRPFPRPRPRLAGPEFQKAYF
jgi:hypothetical protein